MAESQESYPNLPHQVAAIRASLSEPRFATYLTKGGGDEGYALALYLYNARVAEASMFPLGVVEVMLRNAIDALLVARHGPTWHLQPGFRDHVLTPRGVTAVDKAMTHAGLGATRGQVIAELTFDFWSNLLRPEYGDLWRTGLNIVFPNIARTTTRRDVHSWARRASRAHGRRSPDGNRRRRRLDRDAGQRTQRGLYLVIGMDAAGAVAGVIPRALRRY